MAKKPPKTTPKIVPLVIQNARLSFVWAEVLPDFLGQKLPDGSPFADLTKSFTFRDMFIAALNGTSVNPKFEVPWKREQKQKFWMRYLVQGVLADVTGDQAWEYLVPLRIDPGIRLQAAWFPGTIFVDALYYPVGTALAITFRWQPNLPPDKLVPKAYEIFKDGKYSITGETQQLSLSDAAVKILTAMRKRALGDASVSPRGVLDPFSIFTVIQAAGATPDADVRKDDQILKTLEVLTNWPSDTEFGTVPDLNTVLLPTKGHPPLGSALYAERRGRAVWLPALFRTIDNPTTEEALAQSKRTSKLGCYHRNLLFATVQIEMLGRLMSHTASIFDGGKHKVDLTSSHRATAHNGARQLVKLYLGQKDRGDTWRSSSAQRQIWDNCFNDLRKVLKEFGEDALVTLLDPPTAPAPAAKTNAAKDGTAK